nr:DNA topoisomerase 3 [Fusobacterium necrophorum]
MMQMKRKMSSNAAPKIIQYLVQMQGGRAISFALFILKTGGSTEMKLVIAEKPSVAISIAKVIGAKDKKDGYYEGNGYKVSWCVGHLIQMANPDSYDEKYAKWSMTDLPIIPKEYKYEITKSTKKQFTILKKLMNDKEIDMVINACDAGREGESIFRLVYNQANCKKKMKRLWISSMEDSAIKEGFDHLKDGKDYDTLFESAQARAIADWLVGMNISRLYSCLYKQNYSVGRVQTPTLAMIVKRDDEIANFKKEKYHTVELSMDGFRLSTDRIDDEIAAEQLLNLVGDKIEITDVIQKEKITKPDLPFDLTTLQRECNKYFGYSAKQTLDYAQSLYEKKLITYPRTDSRCLTEDMIVSTVNNILGKNDFDTERIKTVFNSKKVTDHHAIIPTVSSLSEDLSGFPESEAKVYRLIFNKLHASVGYPLVENTTKIVAVFDGFEFTSSGKVIKDEGFSKHLKEYKSKKSEDAVLPDVSIGDVLSIENKEIKEKFTQPPKHFTEDTLLKSMEIAGNDALEKGVEVERKGLGTPATRAGIIENLIFKGFVERDKKNLIATHKGISLVTIVTDTFKSAETTAKWEMELSDIAQGKSSKEEFLKDIENEIKEAVLTYSK